jgi:integrase
VSSVKQKKSFAPVTVPSVGATGQLTQWTRSDGSRGFGCRFRFKGKRYHELLGSSTDGMTARKARVAMQDKMAEVRAGRWLPPEEREPEPEPHVVPTFHEFASEWFEQLVQEGGRHGDGLAERSIRDLRDWRLREHVLPFFADFQLDAIKVEDMDRFRANLKREGRLSNASINKMIATVAAVMEQAVEYGHASSNPAKGRRRKLPTTRPKRTYLDRPEQVVALLDAAAVLDGRGWTVPYRRALIATLTFAGLRIGEALELRWKDAELGDHGNVLALPGHRLPVGTIHVRGTKTDNADRRIRLAPVLHHELRVLRERRAPTSDDQLVFATGSGRALSRSNFGRRVLGPAVALANETLAEVGVIPIPGGITPHSLRRTYASLLVVRREDPATVMGQMGHATAGFTLEVYAKAMDLTDAAREAYERLWQGASGQGWGKSELEADFGTDEAEAV